MFGVNVLGKSGISFSGRAPVHQRSLAGRPPTDRVRGSGSHERSGLTMQSRGFVACSGATGGLGPVRWGLLSAILAVAVVASRNRRTQLLHRCQWNREHERGRCLRRRPGASVHELLRSRRGPPAVVCLGLPRRGYLVDVGERSSYLHVDVERFRVRDGLGPADAA